MSNHAVILLVEDREDDVLLVCKAFERACITNPLHIVRSGEEAISYLSGTHAYANRADHPLPDLILLDLKLPGLDGFEVLSWLRKQEGIWAIPVLVLTSSHLMRDVNRAYQLGANSFMVKPLDFENYKELSRALRDYWLGIAKKPQSFRPSPNPIGHSPDLGEQPQA